jgi:hypothetical protein
MITSLNNTCPSKPKHFSKRFFYLVAVILAVSLLLPLPVQAQDGSNDKVIFSGNYTLEEGEILNGDLVVFAGVVSLEKDSTVTGDVAIIGGNLTAQGTILGDLVGLGGHVDIKDEVIVQGDLTVIGSSVKRSPSAEIQGSMMTSEEFPLHFNPDWVQQPFQLDFSGMVNPLSPLMSLVWFSFRLFIWTGLAVLLFLFLEQPIRQIGKTAFEQPGVSFLSGFGIAVLGPILLLILLVTILLSPVGLVGFLILAAAWILGWTALGFEVGQRLSVSLDQTWSPLVSTAVGTFLVVLIFNGFNQIFPICIGWMPKTLLGIWMLGAVGLTRFGSRPYPGQASPLPESPREKETADPARELPPAD